MTGAGTSPTRVVPQGAAVVPAGRATETEQVAGVRRAGGRLAYLDNLKTLMIAGIIGAHAVMGYSTFGSWTYQDVQETTLSPVVETIFVAAVFIGGGLFLMALFFLISGLLTQDSLARKGSSRFVSDRLLRLGVPFAVYTLLVWPLLEFGLHAPLLHDLSFWRSYTNTDPVLDSGPMWFVGVLLLFSLALVAWRKVFPPSPSSPGPLRWRHLVLLSAAVGVSTFVIRIGMFADSNQPLNSHVWGWPEYVAMFGLGVAAARRRWLRPVPKALASRCGIATLLAILCTVAAVLTAEPLGLADDAYFGGWRVTALIAAMAEGVIAVTAPIWILALAQRHLNGTGRLRRAMARSSYAAFMLQGPVIVGLEVALRPTELPGEVKALVVASLAIAGSFALAWPLVTRTALRRIL
jgi:fucose 4-O-acetylase-like acetyltransferase